MLVLDHLVDEPVGLVLRGHHVGRDGLALGLNRAEGAALAVEDPERACVVAVADDGHEHAALTDRGDEGLVQARVEPDVLTHDNVSGVDLDEFRLCGHSGLLGQVGQCC